jgi:hypothetical protein
MTFVSVAHGKGILPRTTPSDSLILRDGASFRTLVNNSGTLTVHGREYEALTGEGLPQGGFDDTQMPQRFNNTETIRTRAGKTAVVRRFDVATGAFTYTRLGRQFFSRRRSQFVVSVPARFSGTRTNGNAYQRDGVYPISSPISLPQSLTAEQRDRRIKKHVTDSLVNGVIAEYSEETVKLREGEWKIVEMTTTPSANGPQTAVTDRRLGVSPVACSLLFPEHIVAQAFDTTDDRMCCPRQISAITGVEFDTVCEALDECERLVYNTETWRQEGCSAKMIFAYARLQVAPACTTTA